LRAKHKSREQPGLNRAKPDENIGAKFNNEEEN